MVLEFEDRPVGKPAAKIGFTDTRVMLVIVEPVVTVAVVWPALRCCCGQDENTPGTQ